MVCARAGQRSEPLRGLDPRPHLLEEPVDPVLERVGGEHIRIVPYEHIRLADPGELFERELGGRVEIRHQILVAVGQRTDRVRGRGVVSMSWIAGSWFP